jgi:AAA family ATP:ADP antiporter
MVWTGTLLLSLAVQPLFATLIARLPRRRFLPLVYHASVACFLGFRAAFAYAPEDWIVGLGYAFYIWFSVFNLFALSVFWGFAADIFRLEQAKRLFAFISVGGTAGAVAGSALAGALVQRIGGLNLLFVAGVLLEIAVVCVHALIRRHVDDSPRDVVRSTADEPAPPANRRSMWRGFAYVAQSPYLQGICAFTFFYTLFKTILYFQTGHLVSAAIESRDARSAYYANVDLAGNVLTLFLQLFVTGRLIRSLGVTFALLTQPIVGGLACLGLGFMIWMGRDIFGEGELALGLPPELLAVAVASVLFNASNYATAKPARESLYTVVERDVKYASKNFVDTFVYRAGDLIAAWSFSGLRDGLAVPLAAIALAGGPLALAWRAVGILLGRAQSRLARDSDR